MLKSAKELSFPRPLHLCVLLHQHTWTSDWQSSVCLYIKTQTSKVLGIVTSTLLRSGKTSLERAKASVEHCSGQQKQRKKDFSTPQPKFAEHVIQVKSKISEWHLSTLKTQWTSSVSLKSKCERLQWSPKKPEKTIFIRQTFYGVKRYWGGEKGKFEGILN